MTMPRPMLVVPSAPPLRLRPFAALGAIAPGLGLCLAVAAAASAAAALQVRLWGRPWLDAVVLAILLGTALRSLRTPSARWQAGIDVCARTVLEIAVVLLGASLSLGTLTAAGPGLLVGIAGVVAVAIASGYAIGRALGLPHRMATLIACGNAICGNSAIAAVAPVIGADADDVAAAIAFTAVFGVLAVLGLPVLVPLLDLSPEAYGALAGLTVYAVPQVLAATAPVSLASVHIGTLVKLVRVLMLGPVVLALSLRTGGKGRPNGLPIRPLVPWFILGFLALAGLRSAGAIPEPALPPIADGAAYLTVVAMAALGLGVDIRVVAGAGPRVTLAVVGSLLVLVALSLGLLAILGIH